MIFTYADNLIASHIIVYGCCFTEIALFTISVFGNVRVKGNHASSIAYLSFRDIIEK